MMILCTSRGGTHSRVTTLHLEMGRECGCGSTGVAREYLSSGGYVWVVIRRFGDPVLRHVCRSLGTRTPMSRIDRPRTRHATPRQSRARRRRHTDARSSVRSARSRGDVALGVVLAFDVVDVALDVARGVDGR